MQYEPVIGLEVHVQLRTATKMFCRCPNRFGARPNTLVCEICLGYPGALPVPNPAAVDQAVRLASALGAEVRGRSIFARKSYFYPDLPKGYQISQYDRPLAVNGRLPLEDHALEVRIQRLHLEEDAGKLLHEAPGGIPLATQSLVDFNRCGAPLLEIVSEPDLRSAAQAQDYLRSLHRCLLYTGTSDGNMEEGSLRCDANVSIRPPGRQRLGTRTEIKNLNSFRHLAKAIDFEIRRQGHLVASGGEVEQQTRAWDANRGITLSLRSKEEAQDYRYFPDPDLPPVVVDAERRKHLALEVPEMPWARRRRLVEEHGLNPEDAKILTHSRELADYFDAITAAVVGTSAGDPQAVAKWMQNDLLREMKSRGADLTAAPPPERSAELLGLIGRGTVSASASKAVLEAMWTGGGEPAAIAEELGLVQVRDQDAIDAWAKDAIEAHEPQVRTYLAGKHQVLGFFVGKVMQASAGQADPRLVRERLIAALEQLETGSGT
ncbi:MAG: Asp-tRNA(Asn)/Glu-tRNA(Gln) amidotransferase subunit GatB [Holophagales bacterium]|nr:Asp-tRNA(Asn)/Glu-tRNA(Gln) amidotransferase subunit GatB [Holophagales bacterium]